MSSFSGSGWHWESSGMVDSELQKVTMVDPLTGFISYPAGVMRTADAGLSWSAITPNAPSSINSIHFYDLNTGMLISTGYVVCDGGAIKKTTNHGDNWTVSPSGVTNKLNNVFVLNDVTAFACGENIILKTTNRGVSWTSQAISSNLRSIAYAGGYVLYCCGDSGGKIYKTTNLGDNWTDVSGSLTGTFKSIYFTDLSNGFVCGTGGKLYKTTNGSSSWSLINLGDTNTINSIYFYDFNKGVVCGNNYKMFLTSNGGANWTALTNPVLSDGGLNSVTYIFPNTIIAVGSHGLIIRSTNDGTNWSVIGIKPISTEVPNNFKLHQNYPNPFNPVTKIRFAIPPFNFGEGEAVRLVIYDLLGRHVETLINEQLKPGIYEVDWDASKYSSGAYFYSLKSESFTQTKKMTLVK